MRDHCVDKTEEEKGTEPAHVRSLDSLLAHKEGRKKKMAPTDNIVPSLPQRELVGSVIKINRAIERKETVYCVHERWLHAVLDSHTRHGEFQVQFADDKRWHAVSRTQVFRKKPKDLPDRVSTFEITSQYEALSHALWLLDQQTYLVKLAAGPDWDVACHRAPGWSRKNKAGVLFSVEAEVLRCFNEQGTQIAPLSFVWEGDLSVIKQCLSETGFDATEADLLSERWQRITVSFQMSNAQ